MVSNPLYKWITEHATWMRDCFYSNYVLVTLSLVDVWFQRCYEVNFVTSMREYVFSVRRVYFFAFECKQFLKWMKLWNLEYIMKGWNCLFVQENIMREKYLKIIWLWKYFWRKLQYLWVLCFYLGINNFLLDEMENSTQIQIWNTKRYTNKLYISFYIYPADFFIFK